MTPVNRENFIRINGYDNIPKFLISKVQRTPDSLHPCPPINVTFGTIITCRPCRAKTQNSSLSKGSSLPAVYPLNNPAGNNNYCNAQSARGNDVSVDELPSIEEETTQI